MKHQRRQFAATVIGLLLLFPATVVAQVPLEVGIGSTGTVTDLPEYIALFFTFAIGAIGIVAAISVMLGGVQWGAALGNPEMINSAKSRIIGGIIGLVLALGSYSLLFALNPNLVLLADVEPAGLDFNNGSCDALGSKVVYFHKDIQQNYPELLPYYENRIASSDSCMSLQLYQSFLNALKTMSTDLQYSGMQLVVYSTFRSTAAQEKLYQCYLDAEPDGTCTNGCSSCNYASPPPSDTDTPVDHFAADAVDIAWKAGSGGGTFETIPGSAVSSAWHDKCMFRKLFTETDCSQELYDSVYALNQLLDRSGVSHICHKWWHHSPSSPSKAGTYCSGLNKADEAATTQSQEFLDFGR